MAWCWLLPIHWNGITKECCKAWWFIGKTKDLWIPCWFESGARSGKESNPWKSSPSFIEWSVFPLCVVKNPEFVLWWNHHIMIILLSMWLWRTIQTQTKEEKKIQDGVIIAKVLYTQERHVGDWMEGHNKGTRIENFPSLIRVSKLK